jgi:Zn-dependent peptidase ImmA (M78 family)
MTSRQTLMAIQRQVWALLRRAGVLTPPVTDGKLERAAALQGASIVDSPSLGSLHGCLSATHQGFVIRINPRLSPAERRYAIAHEIGHTLIDQDIPFPRDRLAHKLQTPLDASPSEREQICDWIAAELLLPQPALAAELTPYANPIPPVAELADEFGTPESAVFLQLEISGHSQLQFAWGGR